MSTLDEYIEKLTKGEMTEEYEDLFGGFPKNESTWEELFDFGENRIKDIVTLRTTLAEREARIAEYKERCLKAIETLNQMESNLLNPPQSQRLIGKIEGVKLALSYLDEIMKVEQK